MAKLFKNYINGKWKASASGRTFENVNPANHSEVLGRFQFEAQLVAPGVDIYGECVGGYGDFAPYV